MSTPTFGSNPRPDTRIPLVGGPDFLERAMEGAALATPQSSKHAKHRKAKLAFGWERSRGSDIFPPRSSRMSLLSETAYLKRADNLVPVPIVCQLAQNPNFTH